MIYETVPKSAIVRYFENKRNITLASPTTVFKAYAIVILNIFIILEYGDHSELDCNQNSGWD